MNLSIRQPRFADDRWYSSDPARLQMDIQGYLAAASLEPGSGQLMGLVAPHAGYFFSGPVAGAAFAHLSLAIFETVILIGPDHWGAAPRKISTPRVDVWRTPLGDIPIAWDILQILQNEIELKLLPTDEEHALEVELPFLQMTLKTFRLVPLMMGDQSPQICRRLSAALVKTIRALQNNQGKLSSSQEGSIGNILFVASSDLSHYFDDDTARRLDQTTLQFILDLDADGLVHHVEAGRRQGQPFACGAGPIATIIHTAKALGATQARLIKYATSADAYPSKDRVVGYAAVAISKA